MPSWSPRPPVVFDFAAASAYIEACQRSAATVDDVGHHRAGVIRRVLEQWRGPRRDEFDAAQHRAAVAWRAMVDDLRREALRVSQACESALTQMQLRDHEVRRWELEAAAEQAAAEQAARDAAARAAAPSDGRHPAGVTRP